MKPSWYLLTTRGIVFCYIASNPDHTMKQAAHALGLTEWSVARAIDDLEDAGLISRVREGRCNTYSVNTEAHFRHPTVAHVPLSQFVELMHSSLVPPQAESA